MKISKLLLIVLTASMVLSACVSAVTPGAPTAVATPTAPQPTATPEGKDMSTNPAVKAAIDQLAAQLHKPAGQITVVSAELKDWSDSCLELGKPSESCAQVATPGYLVVLQVGSATYTAHTGETGNQVRFEGPTDVAQPLHDPVERAKTFLAQQLSVDPSKITVISSEPVDWPDSCLDAAQPGEMCAQMVTPGFRVYLSVDGKTYELNTNRDGSAIRMALQPPSTPSSDLILAWLYMKDNECLAVRFTADSIGYGRCIDSNLKSVPYPGTARPAELARLVATYKSFQSTTPAGDVQFIGKGQVEATPDEQRSLGEWARLVYQEGLAGRGSAAQGSALGWRREGGIAGFCDDLAVYLTGFATPSSCKSGGQNYPGYRLTADELKTLYGYVDKFKRFEVEQKDPATADAMKQVLVFEGAGSQDAGSADRQAILQFAAQLYAAATKTP